jgi:hypothetical protein
MSETTELELMQIEEILDVKYDESDKAKIMEAVTDGRLSSDIEKQKVKYKLLSPIEMANGDVKNELVFRSPSAIDMEKINAGFTMSLDKSGNTIMDMGAMQARTNRAVVRLSGIPTALLERISRKDMRVFAGLFNFFD